MSRIAFVVALVLVIGSAAACGSDEESGRSSEPVEHTAPDQSKRLSSGPQLSKKAFVRKAKRICNDLQVQVMLLSNRYLSAGAPTPEEFAAFAGAAARDLERALSRFRRLGAPSTDKAEISSLIRAAEQGLSRLQNAAQGPAEAERVLEGQDPLAQAQALARRSGLRACGINR